MQLKWPMLWDLFSLFPAYAGVIPYRVRLAVNPFSFPRIRGGDPLYRYCKRYDINFSRIRGGDPKHGCFIKILWVFSPHTRG